MLSSSDKKSISAGINKLLEPYCKRDGGDSYIQALLYVESRCFKKIIDRVGRGHYEFK